MIDWIRKNLGATAFIALSLVLAAIAFWAGDVYVGVLWLYIVLLEYRSVRAENSVKYWLGMFDTQCAHTRALRDDIKFFREEIRILRSGLALKDGKDYPDIIAQAGEDKETE